MDRHLLFEKFLKNKKLEEYFSLIKGGENLLIEELWDTPKAFLTALAFVATQKNIVVITEEKATNHFLDDLSYFSKTPMLEFPTSEIGASDITGDRYQVLDELAKKKTPHIIFTTLAAALQKVLAPTHLESLMLTVKKGDSLPFEEFANYLTELGYHRSALATEKGTFALRGSIIDLFPASSMDPVRIEFFEDEILSIRLYDPISQLTTEKIEKVIISPSDEERFFSSEQKLTTLFDYLGPHTLVIFDDLFALEDKSVLLSQMAKQASFYLSTEQLFKIVEPLQKLYFIEGELETLSEVEILEKGKGNLYSESAPASALTFEAFNQKMPAKRWRSSLHPLYETFCPKEVAFDTFQANDLLKEIFAAGYETHLLFSVESEEKSLKARLEHIPIPLPDKITFEKGRLSSGFCLKEPAFALIPSTEIDPKSYLRRHKHRSSHHASHPDFLALNTGETIVHMNSGIGRYIGVEKRANHLGIETEFLIVEYAEGAKLYVPIEQSHLITKYIGATEEPPELHTLGSTRWKNALQRSEKAIKEYANELLSLQAERALKGGFVYREESALVKQFGEEFPYQETPDQLAAIQSAYGDMVSTKAMDRLICGDVGYGKTEVAMRVALKAVIDGDKQVAVLVPTTVLAMQHYETFCERMRGFPIHIGLLSRFRTPKEIQKTLEEISEGKIDIVIGTHRIVSEDVHFKNLGLIIIDEEQRFGVKTKEHLKKIKKELDCLTLSATPIPRTLYLSLTGAREMSLINTPPEDRLPIQSFICQSSEEVIKNALLRELTRDGQAYFIHNRVETIYEMADRIRKLLPQARIVVGHGQMSAHELDTVFHTFKSGKADILVATSIIENGIDIANANTILIDKADRFGMADLYQMRGRVGRWNKKAYCYFLVSNTLTLNPIARKRLSALAASSGHGGGMKVAMHDLEIRGAGNILGTEQSGHISSIGFTLYCKLLKKTINSMKSEGAIIPLIDVKMEFPYDARLPESYINEMSLRLEIYGRLGEAESEAEVDLLMHELEDRFGRSPLEAQWLHKIARLRVFAARNHFSHLKLTKVVFFAEQTIDKDKKISKKIILTPPKTPEELESIILSTLKKNFPTLS